MNLYVYLWKQLTLSLERRRRLWKIYTKIFRPDKLSLVLVAHCFMAMNKENQQTFHLINILNSFFVKFFTHSRNFDWDN